MPAPVEQLEVEVGASGAAPVSTRSAAIGRGAGGELAHQGGGRGGASEHRCAGELAHHSAANWRGAGGEQLEHQVDAIGAVPAASSSTRPMAIGVALVASTQSIAIGGRAVPEFALTIAKHKRQLS
jgi:hypothetical protein